MNLKCVNISWRSCFQFFGNLLRNGIAGSYGSSILFIYLLAAPCEMQDPSPLTGDQTQTHPGSKSESISGSTVSSSLWPHGP